MTARQPVPPSPAPLEAFAQQFDSVLGKANQRAGFRRYLEGLLAPSERNKTLTALANAEPIVGAQAARVQALQWFLSESTWDAAAVNARRLALLRAEPLTAPDEGGVLVVDEHGDRKWGAKTAHVGRQYLGNIGKVENGVVSVSSLWADEGLYYPIDVEPYTPAHHFEKKQADPAFRTKRQLAVALAQRARDAGIPFRAVVADAFYGKERTVQQGLADLGLAYVLALPPSSGWWHQEGQVGRLQEAARAAGWQDTAHPGRWTKVERRFRDGHAETWWALEVEAGPYGPGRSLRAVVATTDPGTLPERTTWYLVTNLPAPGSARAKDSARAPARLAEIVRLFGLRNWVEQSYKDVTYALGWGDYQVRSDQAIRRHWALVWCAFSFCRLDQPETAVASPDPAQPAPPPPPARSDGAPAIGGENQRGRSGTTTRRLLAEGAPGGAGLAGTLAPAAALLARLVARAPAAPAPTTAGPALAGPRHRSLCQPLTDPVNKVPLNPSME
jgi:SRSO17 transposase